MAATAAGYIETFLEAGGLILPRDAVLASVYIRRAGRRRKLLLNG